MIGGIASSPWLATTTRSTAGVSDTGPATSATERPNGSTVNLAFSTIARTTVYVSLSDAITTATLLPASRIVPARVGTTRSDAWNDSRGAADASASADSYCTRRF